MHEELTLLKLEVSRAGHADDVTSRGVRKSNFTPEGRSRPKERNGVLVQVEGNKGETFRETQGNLGSTRAIFAAASTR